MRGKIVSLLLLSSTLAACARDEPLRSTLDGAGRTWVGPDVMLTFARAAPRFSAAARDYLYLAPVETNDQGAKRQFLWVGMGSTVDRAGRSAAPSEAATLILSIDGVPVALSLVPWDDHRPAPQMSAPAPLYQVRCASVTRDQLERLATARSVEVEIVTAANAVEGYSPWQGSWSAWLAFLAPVELPAGVARTVRAEP